MSKRFLLILAVIFVAFIGIMWFSKSKDQANAPSATDGQVSNNTRGEGLKNVTLVEYGDFQCPSCAAYYPVLKQVKEKYGDDITFQFRHFPLTQIHQNAMAAHRAAEAAARQDKFWEMHDLLYERQQIWGQTNNVAQIMENYAAELGLNIEQFKQDYGSSDTNAIINADIASGNELKITGTPTFLLNGERIQSPPPDLNAFSALIDAAIAGNTQN